RRVPQGDARAESERRPVADRPFGVGRLPAHQGDPEARRRGRGGAVGAWLWPRHRPLRERGLVPGWPRRHLQGGGPPAEADRVQPAPGPRPSQRGVIGRVSILTGTAPAPVIVLFSPLKRRDLGRSFLSAAIVSLPVRPTL